MAYGFALTSRECVERRLAIAAGETVTRSVCMAHSYHVIIMLW